MKRGVIAIILLSACSGQTTFDYETPVKRELSDPDSAQFSDVTVNVESACGFVNSKNGFGGYAGKAPFIAIGGGTGGAEVIFVEGASDQGVVESRCLEPAKSKIEAWVMDKVISDLKSGDL